MGLAGAKPGVVPRGDFSRVASKAPPIGERERAYLLPGQLHASAEPCQIKTILGSCVSICLWDPQLRAGGMNHFLLPASHESAYPSLRFGDVAAKTLIEQLRKFGCRPASLKAKIFGGAAVLGQLRPYANSLGAKNVAAALKLVKEAGIELIAQETGGTQGRKVIFNTDDGVVWSQRI
jgi:chemotaxis protein CheD